ncbi:3'-5' exonuclease-like [Andrographis paniculata]|uniref:3'-5' exonuclease-like n=1 Tax=Andrographis paniculata TaxID=175694 RepID=UPI0021E8778C|nr:3'-5' exonuclease-like [Andrographis paniculata]
MSNSFLRADPYLNSSSISYNAATSKYVVTFAGTAIETTVTDKAAVAAAWVADITSLYGDAPAVVGLDVEWRPHQIKSMSNKSATLQLCIADKCLILQLFYMDEVPISIRDFLMNPNFTFVGIEVADDARKLSAEYGLSCARCGDIRDAAKLRWPGRFSRPGLKDLAKEICGMAMKKPRHVCMSNWEIRVLSEAQIEYACIDAFASYRIGHKLFIEKA